MEDVTKILQNMEAYRQGYQEGRVNVIKGFQKVLERICLDIDEIKELLKNQHNKKDQEDGTINI